MSYGQVNADVIGTSVAGSNLGAGNASIMKNRIINGAMVIDQRNAGAAISAANLTGYTVDRWSYTASQTLKFTAQQNQGSVTPPAGFTNYLGFTSQTAFSPASSDFTGVFQAIEGYNWQDLGYGTANAKAVTASFWVYSSLTGTFSGALRVYGYARSYPFSYSVPVANTWTQITINIAGDTGGTYNTGNNGAVLLTFNLGSGSTFLGTGGAWTASNLFGTTGSVNVAGTNGATFYITGVQLEVGSSATGYEYRQYQQELALCQRYYETFGIGTSGTSRSNTFVGGVRYAVPKRATPTIAVLNGTLSFANGSGTATTLTGATLGGASASSALGVCQDIYGTFSTGPSTGTCIVLLTDNAASVSAEL
jgi:hypothetical protein